MKKTDSKKIIEWRKRRGEDRFAGDIIGKVDDTKREWDKSDGVNSGLADFVPIRLVTLLEVYCREAVRELVEGDDSYLSRARDAVTHIKISFDFLENVAKDSLSVGDLVAHSLSLNSFESLLSALSVFEADFAARLRVSHERWLEEKDSYPLPPIINDFDYLAKHLKHLFEVRHIVVHEVPENPPFEVADIPIFVEVTRKFVEACDWVIIELLQGETPRTQITMNMTAHDEARSAEKELKIALVELEEVANKDLIRTSQVSWQAYAEATSKLIASNVEGGSMYPLVYWSEMKSLTEDRIEELRSIKENWMM